MQNSKWKASPLGTQGVNERALSMQVAFPKHKALYVVQRIPNVCLGCLSNNENEKLTQKSQKSQRLNKNQENTNEMMVLRTFLIMFIQKIESKLSSFS